jgi:hypothetical protein
MIFSMTSSRKNRDARTDTNSTTLLSEGISPKDSNENLTKPKSKFDMYFSTAHNIGTVLELKWRRGCTLCPAIGKHTDISVTDGNTSSMASNLLSTHSTSQEVFQHWQSLVEQGVDLKHNKPFLDKLISKSGLNQQTMHQFFTNSSMPALAKTCLYTQQTFHKYICNLVCEKNISVNTICHPEMKEFIGWLNVVALRDMPNEKKVRRLVEEQYETMREHTDKLIRESATKISLTIDG